MFDFFKAFDKSALHKIISFKRENPNLRKHDIKLSLGLPAQKIVILPIHLKPHENSIELCN